MTHNIQLEKKHVQTDAFFLENTELGQLQCDMSTLPHTLKWLRFLSSFCAIAHLLPGSTCWQLHATQEYVKTLQLNDVVESDLLSTSLAKFRGNHYQPLCSITSCWERPLFPWQQMRCTFLSLPEQHGCQRWAVRTALERSLLPQAEFTRIITSELNFKQLNGCACMRPQYRTFLIIQITLRV